MESQLYINIREAKDLINGDMGGASDPFVTVKVDGEVRVTTAKLSNEANPQWGHETLISLVGNPAKLEIQVWDEDHFSDDNIGHLIYRFADLANEGGVDGWVDITNKKGKALGDSKINMAIHYYPTEMIKDLRSKGNKRALLVGILYKNHPKADRHLDGCINDTQKMKATLLARGYPEENIRMINDADETPADLQPSRDNIMAGMKWLMEGTKGGDIRFFQFSGHGIQREDDDDGEEEDGMDEAILTMEDGHKTSCITDDEVFGLLVKPLPPVARLVSIMDCCHSGTGMDLPLVWKVDLDPTSSKKKIINAMRGLSKAFEGTGKLTFTAREAILFSGCKDDQTSADAEFADGSQGGALTFAFMEAMDHQKEWTCNLLLRRMKAVLDGSFTQKPQLSTCWAMDLSLPFAF